MRSLKNKIISFFKFLSHDIWRVNTYQLSNRKNRLYNLIKVLILSIRDLFDFNLDAFAASLTYKTALSFIPALAVIIAIAKGFGFKKIIESQLFSYFNGQEDILSKIFIFVDNSLEESHDGLFLGVGLVTLFYTVFSLMSNVENNFNTIWRIKQGRTFARKVSDYFAIVIFAPVFLVLNSGLSIFVGSFSKNYSGLSFILGPVVVWIAALLPYVVIILILMFLYKIIPNTRVKTSSALLGAFVAGTLFQILQVLYINGQISITKFNAIYGSFAAIPLFLFWIWISWYIVLYGVELSYASQNIKNFSYKNETSNISRRYRDYFTILILSDIVKRFAHRQEPASPDKISLSLKIPLGLSNSILYDLEKMQLINRVIVQQDLKKSLFQPAFDIQEMSVGLLLTRLDSFGSEDFNKNPEEDSLSDPCWEALMDSRSGFRDLSSKKLLIDL